MNFAAIERSGFKLEPCCCNRRLRLFILLCFFADIFESPLFTLISRLDSERLLNSTLKTASLSNLPESFKYPIRWARASISRWDGIFCFWLYKIRWKNICSQFYRTQFYVIELNSVGVIYVIWVSSCELQWDP